VVVFMVMKKINTLTALAKLNKEAMVLLAKSKMDLDSASFLADEANKLLFKLDRESLQPSEREKIVIQMIELCKRLDYEKNQGELDDVEIKRIERQIKKL
jgi:hypothetical protein